MRNAGELANGKNSKISYFLSKNINIIYPAKSINVMVEIEYINNDHSLRSVIINSVCRFFIC